MYDHLNVLRPETTINNPYGFRVYRTSENDPDGALSWLLLRHGVAGLHRRAQVSQAANERYLHALAGVAETKTVKELADPPMPPGHRTGPKVVTQSPRLESAGARRHGVAAGD